MLMICCYAYVTEEREEGGTVQTLDVSETKSRSDIAIMATGLLRPFLMGTKTTAGMETKARDQSSSKCSRESTTGKILRTASGRAIRGAPSFYYNNRVR